MPEAVYMRAFKEQDKFFKRSPASGIDHAVVYQAGLPMTPTLTHASSGGELLCHSLLFRAPQELPDGNPHSSPYPLPMQSMCTQVMGKETGLESVFVHGRFSLQN